MFSTTTSTWLNGTQTEHQDYYRVHWLSLILPIETFTRICQEVYFAVEDYTDTDFIVANGFLHWLFVEHVIITGSDEYLQCGVQCHENVQSALGRLSLLLQPTMESTAALLVGVCMRESWPLSRPMSLGRSCADIDEG